MSAMSSNLAQVGYTRCLQATQSVYLKAVKSADFIEKANIWARITIGVEARHLQANLGSGWHQTK